MSSWACCDITISQPKRVNIKDLVTESIKVTHPSMDEVIVTSQYSKEDGVHCNMRTTYTGSTFDRMIKQIITDLKKQNVGNYYIVVTNCYY